MRCDSNLIRINLQNKILKLNKFINNLLTSYFKKFFLLKNI